MFTGIIETTGLIQRIQHEGTNVHYTVKSELSPELRIDQSLAHDGCCLTVVSLTEETYTVTAIKETLDRTRLGQWKEGDKVNLERAMVSGARLDGHIVQGHVDTVGECISVEEVDGSWYFEFRYQPTPDHMLVDKGSVCINGTSLTVVDPVDDRFKVAIIPYTYEFTNFNALRPGHQVNLEFDIIGKYIAKHLAVYGK
ncbi:riboflavin synthase [Lewinellaceae bacterium SD302]|nr:riboflavin synthase [Lewinellaceae bacterium SD302]